MKVIYYGDTFCDDQTLKRLLVVAKEIVFMDRPSVTVDAPADNDMWPPYPEA